MNDEGFAYSHFLDSLFIILFAQVHRKAFEKYLRAFCISAKKDYPARIRREYKLGMTFALEDVKKPEFKILKQQGPFVVRIKERATTFG